MIKNVTYLMLFFCFSAQSKTQNAFETQALDGLMLNTCSSTSPFSTCQTRINEIRQGFDSSKLLSGAPKLDIDAKTQVVIVSDSKKMVSDYYCLAQFNELIPKVDFEPDIFAYAVRGFSFSKKSQKPYTKWLLTSASKECRNQLSKIGLEPSPIKMDRPYQIVLNPVTFVEAGAEDQFFASARTAYNHERLHAIFSEEKAESKTIKFWMKLSKGQQEQFTLEHPSYNFKSKKILAREFFSYLFESDPAKAYKFLKGKYDRTSYVDMQKDLCNFCVRRALQNIEMAKTLAQLEAKDLLARVEKEEIKVLILSSGRKNPSPLFNWGKVRVDQGELNQITKLEGSMGKTLCRGEKPESSEKTTIILAADSPYSTLIHEYLHVLQIRRDGSWCPVSKRLWGAEKISPLEQRMIRDREWDVRLVLWNLLDAPHMNVEDRLIVTEGLLNEASLRKTFDPSAIVFIEKNQLKEKLDNAVKEYMEILKIKK